MASEDHHNASVYNEEDLDEDEPLNDAVLDEDEDDDDEEEETAAADDSSDSDTNSTSSVPASTAPPLSVVPISSSVPAPITTSAVNVAILPPSSDVPNGGNPSLPLLMPVATPTTAIVSLAAVTAETPAGDSRRLFQRLWTDEDEIELLQGFLEYNRQRGPNWSGHHHDTTAFYDQIKSKLQLDCNKSQLVEKLRRLKKKYRNVVGKIRSGKDFVFKSPHDQATFEISSKIWSNSTINRPEFDDDDQNPNPSNSALSFGFNLNSAGDLRNSLSTGCSIDINNSDRAAATMMNMGTPNRSRKRPRLKTEDKGAAGDVAFGGHDSHATAAPDTVQNSVEETVKTCLPSLLKELINGTIDGAGFGRGRAGGVASGIGSLALNAIPMNFTGVSLGRSGQALDERWKKQQILELEVYAKRLELVQDQIRSTVEELRSLGN